MLIDDRLMTVLQSSIADEAAARAQYRQLLDLIGTLYPGLAHAPYEAHKRVDELISTLPINTQAGILSERGVKLRNARLIDQLAHAHPVIAEAAIKAASLNATEWSHLAPDLPAIAREMLRLRDDLDLDDGAPLDTRDMAMEPAFPALDSKEIAEKAQNVLHRFSRDEILMDETRLEPHASDRLSTDVYATHADQRDTQMRESTRAFTVQAEKKSARAEGVVSSGAVSSISDLLQRMERLRQSRQLMKSALGPTPIFTSTAENAPIPGIAVPAITVPDMLPITLDSSGTIVSAPDEVAVLFVGMAVEQDAFGAVAWLDETGAKALRLHTPIRGALLTIDAAPVLSGIWLIYAAPLFDPAHGAFTGYTGFLQRFSTQSRTASDHARAQQSDAMRQLLHELRTPVNAIQGFAEVIQQQLFGPVPNEYRALAAGVAMDAARLMAGFAEIERFAKLHSNTLEFSQGPADVSAVLDTTVQRIVGALRPHSASLILVKTGRNFAIALAEEELEQLIWRIVATLAGDLQPGEVTSLALHQEGPTVRLIAELPRALKDQPDVFKAAMATQGSAEIRSISAGMFGTGYSLRLARAEAEAAGGTLVHKEDHLELAFPTMPDENGALNSDTQAMEPAAG